MDVEKNIKQLKRCYSYLLNLVTTTTVGSFTIVNTYADLPPATGNTNKLYIVLQSTGLSWIPSWLGGSFKPKGIYYSDGTSWVYMGEFPYQATQPEVNAEVNSNKFVSPETLGGWWSQKAVPVSKVTNLQTELDNKANLGDITEFSSDISKIELELKLNTNSLERFKVYSYTLDKLTQTKVYESPSLSTELYTINYTYTGDNLTKQTIIRTIDSFTYEKNYIYNVSGDIESIETNII